MYCDLARTLHQAQVVRFLGGEIHKVSTCTCTHTFKISLFSITDAFVFPDTVLHHFDNILQPAPSPASQFLPSLPLCLLHMEEDINVCHTVRTCFLDCTPASLISFVMVLCNCSISSSFWRTNTSA